MKETKRLLKNTGIIAIGNLSTKVITFLLLPLYTSILSVEEYGTIDYIITLSLFTIPIVSFLMDEAIFRFLIDCKNFLEKKKIISSAVFIMFIGIVLFIVVMYPILYYIKYKYIFLYLLFTITNIINMIISSLLRGFGETNAYAIYNFLSSLLQIILNILFVAIFYWGILGMLSAMIIGKIIISIVYIFLLRLWKYISFKSVDKKLVYGLLRYSIPLVPSNLSWLTINLSSRLIIMNTMNSSYVGIYAISSKFSSIMDFIYSFFYQSWKESSARVMNDNDKNEFYNLVYKYLKSFMYPSVLLMIAIMPMIFSLLISDSFFDAINYIPILLIATYFSNIAAFYGGIFTAYKDTKILGITTIISAVLNLVLMIIFIKYTDLGLYIVSIVTLFANIVLYQYRKIKVKKYIILREDNIKILLDWILTTIILVLFYSMNQLLQFLGVIVAIIYILLMNHILIKKVIIKLIYK